MLLLLLFSGATLHAHVSGEQTFTISMIIRLCCDSEFRECYHYIVCNMMPAVTSIINMHLVLCSCDNCGDDDDEYNGDDVSSDDTDDYTTMLSL